MKKFHISKNLELVSCPAKIKCTLNSPHFDTLEEGQIYLDKILEKETLLKEFENEKNIRNKSRIKRKIKKINITLNLPEFDGGEK